MKTISLDVHAEVSQAAVITEDGEVVLETRVAPSVPLSPQVHGAFRCGLSRTHSRCGGTALLRPTCPRLPALWS